MDFHIFEKQDLWTRLKNDTRPIILYGMGNGADKIIKVLTHIGREVSDFFASDEFVRGQLFWGKRVMRLDEIEEKYEDFVILIAFASSLPSVMDKMAELCRRHEVYIPDVSVVDDEKVFDLEFVHTHRESISAAYRALCDDESRRVFEALLNFKLSGKMQYLLDSFSKKEDAYLNILSPQEYRTVLDLGAYNGDSVREVALYAPKLELAVAAEPDGKNYKKLCDYAAREDRFRVIPLALGAYSHPAEMSVGIGLGRGSAIGKGNKCVLLQMDAPDNMISGKVDFIKYDVEGAESAALLGSRMLIEKYRPELLVSLYHRNEDLFSLVLQVSRLLPEYKLYLRKHPSVPAWDINLYCVI